MAVTNYYDGNVTDWLDYRNITSRHDFNRGMQMHSSLIQRLSLEKELEINIWSYTSKKLLHSVDTGHAANIFCTKFIPETSDELVVSGAGDGEVRLFNLSRAGGREVKESSVAPSAVFQCHSRRVKKLAVEVGNPNMVWSASEDGTLRQHDFREGASCPPAGSSNQECRNVLLDLRSGAKKSLADPPKQCLLLKSCDISTTRPHLLLVGGSDAFARIYDRRMLPPMTSCQKKMRPPPCVGYFCPMHLSDRVRSSLHLTHVTFCPDGKEVLLSYSGEHVYLMDVNLGSNNFMKYSSEDVLKQVTLPPLLNREDIQPSRRPVFPNAFPRKTKVPSELKKCNELVLAAEKSLKEGNNYPFGIEACNELLDGNVHEMGPEMRHEVFCIRAALLLKRKWKNDVHMAIRDCNKARTISTSSFYGHYHMSEALLQLGKHKEALAFALAAQCLAPSNYEAAERVESIKEHLIAAEAEKSNKESDRASKSGIRPSILRPRADILYRSDTNSEASTQDGPRSDREDSDYEEEMELDFETSISGDEAHDNESSILRGNLNLKFHRRENNSSGNGSTNGSPSASSKNDHISYQAEAAFDMKQRFIGHCNVGTDIKQASFLGQRGEYVASGSDDGRWFIWEKRTGRLIKMLAGDEAVVNCVQSHPFDCAVATSGIDNTIKLWTPIAESPSMIAGGAAGPETGDVLSVMERNQNKLSRNREVILPLELLERFRMHEFAEGTLHPFECAQA
ncbi:Protein ALTERED SEED GERMINATION 2 [Ranunculus cassubicifolius]